MANIITNAIKFGTIVMDPKYVKTLEEIEHMGEATGYPDIFPMWCTTNNTIYIMCKTDDGNYIATLESMVATTDKAVWYPIVNPATNLISWEARILSTDAPPAVTLSGFNGKSAYQIWLDQGNTGTEQDFLNSLVPDLNYLTPTQISNLKYQLGINDIEAALDSINNNFRDLIG